jgi:hypothetical protein
MPVHCLGTSLALKPAEKIQFYNFAHCNPQESAVITDAKGIQFLQWCLPTLRLRWSGFRKVRRQVYKRLNRHMKELGLAGVEEYRSYLAVHPAEWSGLECDGL